MFTPNKETAHILDDRKKNSAEIVALEALMQKTDPRKEGYAELDRISNMLALSYIRRDILSVALQRAIVAQVAPAIAETLNAYAGKPIGEQRKRQITQSLKEKTGCYIFFHTEANERFLSFTIQPTGADGYNDFRFSRVEATYCAPKGEQASSGNVLHVLKISPETFYTDCRPYDSAPLPSAEEILEKRKAITKEMSRINGLINEYNSVICGGMNYVPTVSVDFE